MRGSDDTIGSTDWGTPIGVPLMSLWMAHLATLEAQMLVLHQATQGCEPGMPGLVKSIERAHEALKDLHEKHNNGTADVEALHGAAMWVGLADDQIIRLADWAGVRRLAIESACSFMCTHHQNDIDAWFNTFYDLSGDQVGLSD